MPLAFISKKEMALLTIKALKINEAPFDFSLQFPSFNSVTDVFDFTPSAISCAPLLPNLLFEMSNSRTTLVRFSKEARAFAPGIPNLFPLNDSLPVTALHDGIAYFVTV
jgi:hypothetical protein